MIDNILQLPINTFLTFLNLLFYFIFSVLLKKLKVFWKIFTDLKHEIDFQYY